MAMKDAKDSGARRATHIKDRDLNLMIDVPSLRQPLIEQFGNDIGAYAYGLLEKDLKRPEMLDELCAQYSKVLSVYRRLSVPETENDLFSFLTMEFRAFRQLVDSGTTGFKPDMHIKLLSDALAFDPTVKITVKLPDGRPEKLKGAKSVTITMPTVLSTHRREMGAALVEALKAAAHKAREIASDTYALWRSALSVAIGRDFGGEGLASGEAKKFATLLDNANTNLYLDCEIAAYSTGKEASDVL